jgi:hypothetical protein
MPQSGGGFIHAYNAQACVDSTTLLIVAAFATQQPNDKKQVKPAIEATKSLPDSLGKVDEMVTDNGYYSETNVDDGVDADIRPLMATGRDKHNKRLEERFKKPEPIPEDADNVIKMKYRLESAEGKAVYAMRKSTVEPVFGIIKSVLGYRQFLRRGLKNVNAEWTLVSLAWNLKRKHMLAKPCPKKDVLASERQYQVFNRGIVSFCDRFNAFKRIQMTKMVIIRSLDYFLAAYAQSLSPTSC